MLSQRNDSDKDGSPMVGFVYNPDKLQDNKIIEELGGRVYRVLTRKQLNELKRRAERFE